MPSGFSTIQQIFERCNDAVSYVQTQAPTLTEPQFDGILLSTLLLQPPIIVLGQVQCVLQCSFVGGQRHHKGREIGDLLFEIRFRDKNGKFTEGKLAYCQSKALKAHPRKRTRKYYVFDDCSQYKALKTKNTGKNSKTKTQYELIEEYEKLPSAIPVFYLLYNPSNVPFTCNTSIQQPNIVGVRVVSSHELRTALTNAKNPIIAKFKDVATTKWRRLEDFVVGLVTCTELERIDSTLFEEKSKIFNEILGASYVVTIDVTDREHEHDNQGK